jgi:hypothetical protein
MIQPFEEDMQVDKLKRLSRFYKKNITIIKECIGLVSNKMNISNDDVLNVLTDSLSKKRKVAFSDHPMYKYIDARYHKCKLVAVSAFKDFDNFQGKQVILKKPIHLYELDKDYVLTADEQDLKMLVPFINDWDRGTNHPIYTFNEKGCKDLKYGIPMQKFMYQKLMAKFDFEEF